MVRPLKVSKYKVPKKLVPEKKQSTTPLIWYGGKSNMADLIISQFPPHETFVEVFGGGGAVTMRKETSVIDIFNDIGSTSNFYKILRDHGEELYEKLYLTPYSRGDFEEIRASREHLQTVAQIIRNGEELTLYDKIEWARSFYVCIMQSYSHEENASSWKNSKTMDLANNWNTHIEDLPRFVERLRKVVIENQDFMKILKMYDAYHTLFYLDPPYVEETRSSKNNYVHEMPVSRHEEMLFWLTTQMTGQAIVSMYDHQLYNKYLAKWRKVEKTQKGMIHNNSVKDPGTRTEILWVKEHQYGLWGYQSDITQAEMAGMGMEEK